MTMDPRKYRSAGYEGLVVNEVGEDVLVYDQVAHTIHHLNATAAMVWQHTAANQSTSAIAMHTGLAQETVRLALTKLDDAGLLATPLHLDDRVPSQSRRSFLKKAGLAATLPTVLSLSAPLATQALSPGPQQCGLPNAQCAPGQTCCGSQVCCNDGTQVCHTDPSPFCITICADNRLPCRASPTNPGQCCSENSACIGGLCRVDRPGGSN